ncbi:MAG: ATP-binding protein [Bacteroidota bacterium]
MKTHENKYEELIAQNEDLTSRLEEAMDIINAIRYGEVDAVIINKGEEPELYTLKTADHTYRVFIEKMTDGAVTLNKEGIILYCNSSFANMLGLSLSEVLAKAFEDLVHPKYKTFVNGLIKKAWKNDCKGEIILSGLQKEIPVLLSVNTLEIDGGKSLSIVITDLSFQKEMQEQKKAMEQKDEFISIASHELKTPVTSIKGYLQILRHGFNQDGNAKAEEMLGKAETQVNKLTKLINELLDVKKMETGQLQFAEEPFDFNEMIKEIFEENESLWTKHIIRYHPRDDGKVLGDKNKIGQVVINLIDNACKYSPEKSVINISATSSGNKIKFSVADAGIGISPEQQERVFERFYRVKGLVESTYPGLGLGLYICAEIIKRHGGTIGVTSEEGKGSVFYFELPLL